MKSRETNRKMLFIFVLYAFAVVVVTWTIGEKFLSHMPRLSLAVNIVAGIAIGVLFERYLESKLNSSVDFLVSKVQRVAKGDLTQVFKEDPDDILPYGLCFELGRMMKYFRENIGVLWRTTSTLVKQLGMFIAASKEVLEEFRGEVANLAELGRSLDRVRKETADILKRLSELKVNCISDMKVIEQVQGFSRASSTDVARNKTVLKAVQNNVTNLRDSLNHLGELLDGFTELSRNAGAVEKAISDLTTQANLVKLNVSIDSTQDHMDGENYHKLVEETRKIVDSIAMLASESSSTLAGSDGKIREFARELELRRDDLGQGLEDIRTSHQLLDAISDKTASAGSGYDQVAEHVANLNGLLERVDTKINEFSGVIRSSEGTFDKLYSDTHLTLMKFDELGSKINAIEENLMRLEKFNRLFEIA